MINLLPPKQKEELKEEKILSLVLVLGTVVLASLVSLTLILFAIKTSFAADFKEQQTYFEQKEEELKTSELQQLEQKIKEYNLILSELEAFYRSQPDLTLTLEKISRFLPENKNIYLTSLNFNPQTSQVSLGGFSPDPKSLLRLEEALKNTKEVKEVMLGPEDWWIKQADINFTVRFKIEK